MTNEGLEAIKKFAAENDIDHLILLAILNNESNLKGFYNSGIIKSRYEKHIHLGFFMTYNGQYQRHPQLPAFDIAWVRKHTLQDLIILSTSYGIAQIMGYHYQTLGYDTPKDLLNKWSNSETEQIKDFLRFITLFRGGKFLSALKDGDTRRVSRYYNGSGYKQNHYEEKLIAYINEHKK